MSWLDVVIAVPLLWALYKGYTEGVILQLGGIAGLLVGVWLAFRYGRELGLAMKLDPSLAPVVGFVVIVAGVLIAIGLLGRLAHGLFKITGLGMFDTVGGVVLGGLKMALILSVLLCGFDYLNGRHGWVSGETLGRSRLYAPVKGLGAYVFPYVDFVQDKLLGPSPDDSKQE